MKHTSPLLMAMLLAGAAFQTGLAQSGTPGTTTPSTSTQTTTVTQTAVPQTAAPQDAASLAAQARSLAARARATGSFNIDDTLWKGAAAAAEGAVAAEPSNADYLKLRAGIYTEVGYWRLAASDWNAYLAVAPDDAAAKQQAADAQYNLGYAAYQRGDLAAAPAPFARCLQLDPKAARCAQWGGRVALEGGDYAGAAQLYQQALSINPGDKVSAYFLNVSQNAGKYGPAATRAFTRAYTDEDAGNAQKALTGFQAATAAAPNFIEAWREQGRLALQLNDAQVAKTAYDAAAALPGATAADRYNQSVAAAGVQVGLQPAKTFRDAYALYAAGNKAGAEAGFLKATQQNPQYQKAWSWLGRVRYEARNYPGAAQAYGQAVQLDPTDKTSAYYLKLAQAGK